MRLLLCDDAALTPGDQLDRGALRGLYAVPADAVSWLRVNFVSSLDGAVTGADGLSGSLNTPADGVVFDLLRELSDAVLVGAGTLEAEKYGRLTAADGVEPPVLVVVSSHARVPDSVAAPRPGGGPVMLLTAESAPAAALAAARDLLGGDAVLVCGEDRVDLAEGRSALAERGLRHLLCEGGPHLFADLLAAGQVDELDLTLAPRLVAGDSGRISVGDGVDLAADPVVLVEDAGTLMGRWLLR